MIISIHQPAYLPWLGYFHKILLADVFVVLDVVQYEKNSFINRNKIKTGYGVSGWLTVPIKRNMGLKENFLTKTEIDNARKWSADHYKTIELNYVKTPYYRLYQDFFRGYYQKDWRFLNDLCKEFLQFIVAVLEIKTEIVYASELPDFETKKSDLVLDICKYFCADFYVSGNLGKDYLLEGNFTKNKIRIYYQDFHHPVYRQKFGEFISNLSILDALFNIGAKETVGKILEDNITKEELIKNLYE